MNIMKINQYQLHLKMYGCRLSFNGLKIHQNMFPSYETSYNSRHLKQFVIIMCRSKTSVII